MFTDVYFTNLALNSNDARIIFFQKKVTSEMFSGTVFKVIQKCQYNWSHKVRIPWDLSFRLVKSSGNSTSVYYLKEAFKLSNKKILLSKDGTVFVNQNYSNGNQVIDFNQIKGGVFSSVQIYRGKFLISEQYFTEKSTQFQIDTNISLIENYAINEGNILELNKHHAMTFDFDFIGIKAIHLSLKGDENLSKLIVDKTEQW